MRLLALSPCAMPKLRHQLQFSQGVDQVLPRDRLPQLFHRAETEPLRSLVDDRDDEDRNIRNQRIGFRLLEKLPAVHPWQQDVEDDRGGKELSGAGQSLYPVGSRDDLEPSAGEIEGQ